jgi:LmbE family N-acetylglucosaminyl deacetylase
MSAPLLTDAFPHWSSVLAVCAHPDDESFGLGALLHRLAAHGAQTSVLCFTHGEASTLGPFATGLREIREHELTAAARELGVGHVEVLDHPDGALSAVPLLELADSVDKTADEVGADVLLVFDEGGVSGHPDHRRATEAALEAGRDLPVLAWNVPRAVGDLVNAEFGTTISGRDDGEFDLVLTVDREVQGRAIACHASQSTDNPVLWRRLELLGDTESVRWLRPPAGEGSLSKNVSSAFRATVPVSQGGIK